LASSLLPFQEDDQAQRTLQTLVLAVKPPASPSYQFAKFVDALQKASLFQEVGHADRLPRTADLILESWLHEGEEDPFSHCSLGLGGEILVIGTAGLIPQICRYRHRVSFDLYSAKSEKKLSLTLVYEKVDAVGWVALLYHLSSDWTARPSEQRYRDLVRSLFYRRAREIQALLQ
jgi:hypothetical protein